MGVGFSLLDANGNEFELNGTGISTIIAGSLHFAQESFEWDNRLADNSALPGAIQLGVPRLKSRKFSLLAEWTFATDAAYRTEMNNFLNAAFYAAYVVDTENNLRARVAVDAHTIAHDDGAMRRKGQIELSFTLLDGFWEDATETVVTGSVAANTDTLTPAISPKPLAMGFQLEIDPVSGPTLIRVTDVDSELLIELAGSPITSDSVHLIIIDTDNGTVLQNGADLGNTIQPNSGYFPITMTNVGKLLLRSDVAFDYSLKYRSRYYV